MQLSSILLFPLLGSVLSLIVPEASNSQLTSRDDSLSGVSARSELEHDTRSDTEGSKLQARSESISKFHPLKETDIFNLQMGAVISVEQLRYTFGIPVGQLQGTISHDLDILANMASQRTAYSGSVTRYGTYNQYKLTWTMSGHQSGSLRIFAGEWSSLLHAAYRKVSELHSNNLEVFMNVESVVGFDWTLTVS